MTKYCFYPNSKCLNWMTWYFPLLGIITTNPHTRHSESYRRSLFAWEEMATRAERESMRVWAFIAAFIARERVPWIWGCERLVDRAIGYRVTKLQQIGGEQGYKIQICKMAPALRWHESYQSSEPMFESILIPFLF